MFAQGLGFLLCAFVALLYMWPIFIVQENVHILDRTYTNGTCYLPYTTTTTIECYQGWRLALYETLEAFLLNQTLSESYFLWSLVQAKDEGGEPHWHFYQAVEDEDDAQEWVLDVDSTCNFFVAHRLSFVAFLWDLLRGTPKGPFIGLYFHLI